MHTESREIAIIGYFQTQNKENKVEQLRKKFFSKLAITALHIFTKAILFCVAKLGPPFQPTN